MSRLPIDRDAEARLARVYDISFMQRYGGYIVAAAALALFVFGLWDLEFSLTRTIAGLWQFGWIIGLMLPPNPGAALHEMQRALKPGGCLLFVEHGLSQEPRIIRWQHRLTPCWKHIGGGCHLDRKMDDLIRAAGFRVDALETGYMKGPKPWTFLYQGAATK